MEKTYQPQAIESHWYQTWEKQHYFAPKPGDEAYCIMIPPPNVTGRLHMGHGFQHSIMDTLIRFQRMCGKETLWQVGTDHAGIATQMVVERLLNQENISRHDLGRDKFVEKVWEWKERSGGLITQQIRRLGDSVDWSREHFTMDADLSHAVQTVFIRLYEEGLIYRGQRLVNWDPVLLTAISDLEVITQEEQGHLWHIRYPLADGSGHIVIATTRPETMLGDTAVAVHPEDSRYSQLIGKTIKLPLCEREIPIIADEYVAQDFGSGCVKITPAHDFNDYAMGQRHQLPMINIFTAEAKINEHAPTAYQGMDRYAARQQIVDDLQQLGLLEKVEDHTLSIPRGDRSGSVVEPYLTDQWFVKAAPLAEPALDVVKQGKVRFIPETWSKTYYQWLENIQDWCISRQLWWGHRIPAWYDAQGNIYVGEDEAAVRAKHQLGAEVTLTQDPDVLDTWFSSALWPFSTLGWPESTPELKRFYPSNVLVTGFDIIFFWVARMIMMGLKFTGEVPFHEVYITGLIRDSEGHKMSKSKGNILDPIDLIDGIDLASLIEKRTAGMMQPQLANKITQQTKKEFPQGIAAYGTDALRFTFCALAGPNREIRFDLKRLEGNRNFCNKLWNAARFILLNTEQHAVDNADQTCSFSLADRWIQTRLQHTIQQTRAHFADYRFDLMTQCLYEFTWHEFCDWYLELVKPVLYTEDASDAAKQAARTTVIQVLEQILRLLHPIMPFITEEIWQRVAPLAGITGETIMLQPYPEFNSQLCDNDAEENIHWLQQVIIAIRNIRGEMNIAPGRTIPLLLHKGEASDRQRLQQTESLLKSLAKISEISWLEANDTPPPSATGLVGQLEIHIPLAGLIDVTAETQRLHKQIEKLDKEMQKSQQKLSNEKFVQNAPQDIVAQEQSLLSELQTKRAKLQQQLNALQAL
jgi:valyl-tRNA synthetase